MAFKHPGGPVALVLTRQKLPVMAGAGWRRPAASPGAPTCSSTPLARA